MKIVILDGSHNKCGHTIDLVNSFTEGITFVRKANIVSYDLVNEKIEFCKGCENCSTKNEKLKYSCIINDSCKKIQKDAFDADIVVFASPIYTYSVTSAMKRFLERCVSLATFSFGPAPKAKVVNGKRGVIICPSGAPFPFNHLMGFTRNPKQLLNFGCKLFGCSDIHIIYAGGLSRKKTKEKYQKKAFELGQKIAKKTGPN
ncbi:MAG: flavodoxin family protein [Candidatus Nanoarchaeia archaeon]